MRTPWLAELTLYPLKGARGSAVARWEVDRRGLRGDRRWMVVSPEGKFLTQRTHPRLALIRAALTADALHLTAPGEPPITLSVGAPGAARRVSIWDDQCEAVRLEAGSEWIARFLGQPAELVWLPEGSHRPVPGHQSDQTALVGFADAYPFLLAGRASLAELNRRLDHPLPMTRFRPNLVVAGAVPFAEDEWRLIRIGGLEFEVAKGCARCAVTMVEQESGVPAGPEPLRTLARFRRRDGEVWFGQNLVHRGLGQLRVGDPVEVLA